MELNICLSDVVSWKVNNRLQALCDTHNVTKRDTYSKLAVLHTSTVAVIERYKVQLTELDSSFIDSGKSLLEFFCNKQHEVIYNIQGNILMEVNDQQVINSFKHR